MAHILVTGGAGFIGSHVIDRLLAEHHSVVCLDDLSTGKKNNMDGFAAHPEFEFVLGDIRNYALVESILQRRRITHISHQAARGSVPKSIEDPLLTSDINVQGTLQVLKAAKEQGIEKVVLAISSSIYGDTPELPKHEGMPYNPKSPYAVSKAAAEMYARTFQTLFGLQSCTLRYFNVYGPRQDPNGAYAAVIPKFIQASLAGEPLSIFGDGKQTRDFTYVQDVVQANFLALFDKNATGAFNIACGNRISVNELAETVNQLTGSSSIIGYLPSRKGDITDSLAATEKAAKTFGFHSRYALQEGLSATVKWFREKKS